MNKFLSKFGFGSSSLATRDNSNNNSSNKKKKNSPRNIINARRAAIHIQAIYRVLNQKLDGQTRILEKKQWPINDDVINGLTRQEAIGYVKQLNLNNVYTRERKKKFGGSQHKCAIDALINERKKYVDEESS